MKIFDILFFVVFAILIATTIAQRPIRTTKKPKSPRNHLKRLMMPRTFVGRF